jgi:hypothetical protein
MTKKFIEPEIFPAPLPPAALAILFHIYTTAGPVTTTQELNDYFPDGAQEIDEAIDELQSRGLLDVTDEQISNDLTTRLEITTSGDLYMDAFIQKMRNRHNF